MKWKKKPRWRGNETTDPPLPPWGCLGRLVGARALVLWSRPEFRSRIGCREPRGQQRWLPDVSELTGPPGWSPPFWGKRFSRIRAELKQGKAGGSSSEMHFREEEGPFTLKIRGGCRLHMAAPPPALCWVLQGSLFEQYQLGTCGF